MGFSACARPQSHTRTRTHTSRHSTPMAPRRLRGKWSNRGIRLGLERPGKGAWSGGGRHEWGSRLSSKRCRSDRLWEKLGSLPSSSPCICLVGLIAGFRRPQICAWIQDYASCLNPSFMLPSCLLLPTPRRIALVSARLDPSIFQSLAASCHHWPG